MPSPSINQINDSICLQIAFLVEMLREPASIAKACVITICNCSLDSFLLSTTKLGGNSLSWHQGRSNECFPFFICSISLCLLPWKVHRLNSISTENLSFGQRQCTCASFGSSTFAHPGGSGVRFSSIFFSLLFILAEKIKNKSIFVKK